MIYSSQNVKKKCQEGCRLRTIQEVRAPMSNYVTVTFNGSETEKE